MTIYEELKKIGVALVKNISKLKKRRIYEELRRRIGKKPNAVMLRGLRGVGKTTLFLQLLNEFGGLYFSADWPEVIEEGLFNILKEGFSNGEKIFYVDEIHRYINWENEIKAFIDRYSNITLFFTGSSSISMKRDRRFKTIELSPMSFGEYLKIKEGVEIKVDDWENERKGIETIGRYYEEIEKNFSTYMEVGGFPFSLSYEKGDAKEAIYNVIAKAVREDSIEFLKLSKKKVFAMEKLLILLATSPPGEISITSLSKNLGVSKVVVYEIINALKEMEIIRIIYPFKKGAALIRKQPKLLFTHPNIRASINYLLKKDPPIGSMREELAVFCFIERGYQVWSGVGRRKMPDYVIKKGDEMKVVEIGGKGKSTSQFEGKRGIVVSEDMLKTLSLF